MADDESLTCASLTHRRRRRPVDLHVVASDTEACATWTCFRVDPMADHT